MAHTIDLAFITCNRVLVFELHPGRGRPISSMNCSVVSLRKKVLHRYSISMFSVTTQLYKHAVFYSYKIFL